MSVKNNGAPGWFMMVGILALFWNVAGVASYISEVTMTPDTFARLPQAQQDLLSTMPGWVTGAFAVAVFSGALGCVLLIMRKSAASLLLQISFAAVLVRVIYFFFMTRAAEVLGPGAMGITVATVVISAALALLAFKANSIGWLR